MKICIAQTKPVKGDIAYNIEAHKALIHIAVSQNSDIIIFPELSITGYEPTLADALATTPDDSRFEVFQTLSDIHQIIIGIGIPTRDLTGLHISMVLYQPQAPYQVYSKKYLHADEDPFFISGYNTLEVIRNAPQAALSICYELSVPEHAQNASTLGANLYVSSVAKTAKGVATAIERLAEIARTYAMSVVMSNCIGLCDGAECAGRSSVWNKQGVLLGQLDDMHEGILVFDTDTQEVVVQLLETA
ncbi:carbon-nitrogen hydrolase family protein [Cytophagaceae bacterium YF14B1]|uniref:Carbon-nitrogen hydrolase family protein n=1 Tax=Xanthocytophaga flava TaxID=3048013 RepID=A0AAE3QHW6_9BACT|nr:carbon-nitrogen hydrolase family protein [Xanthocytophaga flavus]MDJ1479145.1 carbon-nitrogen hydrolase family protein [Xanthocytophaga flavus]